MAVGAAGGGAGWERTVQTTFIGKDVNLSKTMKSISRESTKLTKDLKRQSETITTYNKVNNAWRKSAETTWIKTTKKMTKQIGDLGNSMYRTGRRTMYMGFVMSSIWRRVTRAMSGIVNAVGSLIKQFSSAEQASEWLGNTLQRLAMGGELTGDQVEDVIRIWQKWWEVSIDLGREIAELEIKFLDLKITAAESTVDFVDKVNDKLAELDWEKVKDGVGAMADAFYDELLAAINKITADEGLDNLIDSLEAIGTLAGTFMAGVIERSSEVITALGKIVGEGGDEGTGLKWVVHWTGKLMTDLGLIAIPAVVLGAILAGFGQIITAVRAAWMAVALLSSKIGLLPVELVLSISIVILGMIALNDLLSNLDRILERAREVAETLRSPFRPGGLPFGLPSILPPLPDLDLGYNADGNLYGPPEDVMQGGGLVSRTGLYSLHAGERVISSRGRGGNTFGNITFNVYGARNPEETAQAIARKVRSVLLLP